MKSEPATQANEELAPWLQPTWERFQQGLQNDRLAHALLIHGPEGCGKLALAQRMAARLLCTQPGDQACGACRSCALYVSGAHPDWNMLEPEEGKHQVKVDQIRALINALSLTTSFSTRKVALIWPAEAMNPNAANALLKSLEEPPGDTLLLLVCNDAARLPITIRSRCQAIAVPNPEGPDAVAWLQQQGLDEPAAQLALEAAGGSPYRAMALHNDGQVSAFGGLRHKLSVVLQQPALASKLAIEAADMPADTLWYWLSRCCAEALSAALTGQVPAWLKSTGQLRLQALADLQKHADRNRLFSRSSVRQDLLLQEWLIKWSRLPQTQAS